MNRETKYWRNRANLRMDEYHKNSDEAIALINAAYEKAIKQINEDINKIFYKFMKDGGLTESETRDLLNSNISKKDLDNIRSRVSQIQDEDLKAYMIAELNTKAYKARITRLESIKESISINLKKAADVEIRQSELNYINNIKEAYYRNTFDVQKQVGVGFDFAEVETNKIEEILKNNWSGQYFSQRVWQNTDALAEELTKTITTGLIAGTNSRKMATEIQELSKYGKHAAERLIRTETTYVTNMAEIESYRECGIEKYVFVATLDLRTSKTCRAHDKKIYEVTKAVPGDNLPPLHPYCRSTTIAYKDKETLNNLRRRARDPQTGKTYVLPKNMSYDEWYKKYVVEKYGAQEAEKFEHMIKNQAFDNKQYKKYKEILGKDAPKSFEDFKKMKYNDSNKWNELKEKYQEVFVKKEFKDIEPLFKEKLSNLETRKWYKWHDENIPNLIDKTQPIEEQAKQAHNLRNTYRTQARDLMKNQEERKQLDIEHPNKSFENLISDKMDRKKITREEAIEDTLKTATKTNKNVNKSLGLE